MPYRAHDTNEEPINAIISYPHVIDFPLRCLMHEEPLEIDVININDEEEIMLCCILIIYRFLYNGGAAICRNLIIAIANPHTANMDLARLVRYFNYENTEKEIMRATYVDRSRWGWIKPAADGMLHMTGRPSAVSTIGDVIIDDGTRLSILAHTSSATKIEAPGWTRTEVTLEDVCTMPPEDGDWSDIVIRDWVLNYDNAVIMQCVYNYIKLSAYSLLHVYKVVSDADGRGYVELAFG